MSARLGLPVCTRHTLLTPEPECPPWGSLASASGLASQPLEASARVRQPGHKHGPYSRPPPNMRPHTGSGIRVGLGVCRLRASTASEGGPGPALPSATPDSEGDGNEAIPGPTRAPHACALAPVTNVQTAAAETARMTPRHCRKTRLDEFIVLCRPAELKFANLLVVRCSSTLLNSSAARSITPRFTVRPEFQSERPLHPRYHLIREGKIIPVGLADA